MRSIALILTTIFLSSCSAANTRYVPISIPVKEYSKAEQVQVGNELKACGDKCKGTKEFLKDGHVLRQAAKETDK